MLTIEEGAIFVADSHYPHHGDAFLTLLERLEEGSLSTPQLFLMGDNFDLLFGYNETLLQIYPRAISLLQRLSRRIEIHYLEGNHDFALAPIFETIHLYPRAKQPLMASLGGEHVALSHGDRYGMGILYEVYTALVRSPWILRLLHPFGQWLIAWQCTKLQNKAICREFEGFEKRVEKILSYYPSDIRVIEGHFHQGVVLGRYLSLPSLACQGEVGVVEGGNIVFAGASKIGE